MLSLLRKRHIPAAPRPARRVENPNRMPRDTATEKSKEAIVHEYSCVTKRGGPPTRYDGQPASLYACIFPHSRYLHAIACLRRLPE